MNKGREPDREFLRHTVATLAYRGGKAVRGAPESFGAFRIGERTRTPLQILAHLGDLLDWALSLAKGAEAWRDSTPGSWSGEVTRFLEGLERFDRYLGSSAHLGAPAESLFQGPIADALTHVGQIAMLRRLAGAPMRDENYFKADIVAGRVGSDQAKPDVEFD